MNARQFVIATAFAGLLACPAAARADDPYRPAIEEVAGVKAPSDPSEEVRRRKLAVARQAILLQQQQKDLKAAVFRQQMQKKGFEKPAGAQPK
jgi:hypothetical protein